jgi:hypothetical protein
MRESSNWNISCVSKLAEGRWNNDTSNRQCQQATSGCSDYLVEELLNPLESTKEEAHPYD